MKGILLPPWRHLGAIKKLDRLLPSSSPRVESVCQERHAHIYFLLFNSVFHCILYHFAHCNVIIHAGVVKGVGVAGKINGKPDSDLKVAVKSRENENLWVFFFLFCRQSVAVLFAFVGDMLHRGHGEPTERFLQTAIRVGHEGRHSRPVYDAHRPRQEIWRYELFFFSPDCV